MMPEHPRPTVISGSPSHRLIRGVLKVDAEPRHIERIDLVRTEAWTASIVDSGDGRTWTPDGDTTLHVLWQADEANATIIAGGQRYPIAPGDTMAVPGGATMSVSAGMLLVRIEATSRSLERVIPPHHGTETFQGHNRETDYAMPDAFSLRRWKITAPLTLPASSRRYAVIDLATPLALLWRGGTDLIGRGEARVIPPGTGPVTLLPDGLGYALVIE